MGARLRCSYYEDCKARLYPQDPEAGGRYRALCDVCYAYQEATLQSIKKEPQWTKAQRYQMEQLKSEVQGWRQKHAEMMLALDKLLKSNEKKSQSKWE